MKHTLLSAAWKSLALLCLFANVAAAQTTTPTPTFIIQSTVSGGGFVDPSAAVVDQGGGKIFKFIPAAGNIVSDVKLDGTSIMSSITVSGTTGYGSYKLENVSAAHTLAVKFIADPTPPSTITTTFTGNGAVEPAVYTLKNGKTKSFKFTAAPGNIVSDVKVDGASVMSEVKVTNEGAKGTYTMPYSVGNHTIATTFITDPTPPITVTATAIGQGVVEPATAEIKNGKYKTFKFTAMDGYILESITVDEYPVMYKENTNTDMVKVSNDRTKASYKMNYEVGNHAIAATFIPDPTPASTITVTSTGPGTVEPATYLLKEGKSKTFKFVATDGNVISGVTVNGTDAMSAVTTTNDGAKGSLKLDYAVGNKTIAVTFSADQTPPSTVTCTWTGQGIADPASFVLTEGKTKTINFYPVTGNQITAVTVDGTSVMGQTTIASSGKGSYKLNYTPGSHTIAITFSPKQ